MSYVQALFMLGALLIAMSMQLDRKGLWNLLGPVLCAILFMVTAWVSMVSQWQPSIIYTYPSLLLSISLTRSNIVCIFHNLTILGWASSDQLHVINYTPTLFADTCACSVEKQKEVYDHIPPNCGLLYDGLRLVSFTSMMVFDHLDAVPLERSLLHSWLYCHC